MRAYRCTATKRTDSHTSHACKLVADHKHAPHVCSCGFEWVDVNAPLPHQLTTEKLMEVLEDCPGAVVCIEVPITEDYFLTKLKNLKVLRASGPVVVLGFSDA